MTKLVTCENLSAQIISTIQAMTPAQKIQLMSALSQGGFIPKTLAQGTSLSNGVATSFAQFTVPAGVAAISATASIGMDRPGTPSADGNYVVAVSIKKGSVVIATEGQNGLYQNGAQLLGTSAPNASTQWIPVVAGDVISATVTVFDTNGSSWIVSPDLTPANYGLSWSTV